MPERINFTKAKIRTLPLPPPGTRATYHDAKIPGLQLRVTPAGVKTFSVFRRVKGGGPERITIGVFPSTSIEQARKRAATINSAIDGGANPAEAKQAHRSEPTFAELFRDYLAQHARPKKRTWEEDQTKYELHLAKPLGAKKLSVIDRSDLAAIHSAITRAGKPTTANRVLALVSSVFGWASSYGLWEGNPAKGIRRNAERKRDRFLQPAELPRFFKALNAEPNDTLRDYFQISLLTGARRSNVLAIKWREIGFERAEWRIPRTKNNEPQTVPLMPEAIAILKRRQEKSSTSFVFPGSGKTGHLVEPKSGWRRILDRDELEQLTSRLLAHGKAFVVEDGEALPHALRRARLAAKKLVVDVEGARMPDVRIHDLRRTLGSWQARTGASLAIIGKSLGHKMPQTTAIYARLDVDPVRESMERATSAILVAAGERPSADVSRLKERRAKARAGQSRVRAKR
jgi:integrase